MLQQVLKSDSCQQVVFHFPNPVENNLQLQWNSNNQQEVQKCIVRDMEGRALLIYHPVTGSKQISIPVSHIASGMYLLDVWVNNQHAVQKFIKQ